MEGLFLDTQFLWGVVFDSPYIAAEKKSWSDFNTKEELFIHGVTFKLGVGYRF
jgi:hypothetical protein